MRQRKISQFKKALEKKRNELIGRVTARVEEIRNASSRREVNKVGDDGDRAFHNEEDDKMIILAEISSMTLGQINRAISKIDNGTFSICSDCSEEISEIRLKAQPWSERCLRCEKKKEARDSGEWFSAKKFPSSLFTNS